MTFYLEVFMCQDACREKGVQYKAMSDLLAVLP